MKIILEDPVLRTKKVLVIFIFLGLISGFLSLGLFIRAKMITPLDVSESASNLGLVMIQENSLLAISNPFAPVQTRKIRVVITAYSSDPHQTDSTPFVTASGGMVKDGIVANNLLPFGTKIKIPELYGNKVFEVQDRMNWKKSYYQVDIWFPNTKEAKNFGVKKTYIEILEG